MAIMKVKLEIPEPKTVTDIFDEVKHEMCRNYCKHEEACTKALNANVNHPCPLDRL